jgi:hypothetical protein
MKRMAKLSLTAVAALCMMASLGAPSASADRFVAEVSLGELPTVEVHPVEELRLKLGGAPELKCTQYGWSGKFDEWRDPEVSAEPAYGTLTCTGSGWGESELETNGCNLVFSPGVLSKATLAIGPAGCGPMRLSTHGGFCEYSFAPQAVSLDPLAGEGTPATVPVTVEDTLAYTHESSMSCGSKAGVFLLQSEWELKAYSEGGSQAGLKVVRNGIWFDPGSAQFKAEGYPDTFIGEPDASSPHSMKIGSMPTLNCQSARLKAAQVTAATSTIAVAPELSGCTVNLLGAPKPAKFTLNSCSYAIGAPSSGPPYADAVDIACSKEGDSIGLIVYGNQAETETLCKYQIAPQSGLSSVELENLGSGDARAIDLTFKLEGIAVKRTQGGPLVCGKEVTTATHSGGNTLYG